MEIGDQTVKTATAVSTVEASVMK